MSKKKARLVWLIVQDFIDFDPKTGSKPNRYKGLKDGKLLKLPNYGYFGDSSNFKISDVNPLEEVHGKLNNIVLGNSNGKNYLILEVEYNKSDEEKILSDVPKYWKDDENKSFTIGYSIHDLLVNIAKNIIICLNIIKPGSVVAERGYTEINDEKRTVGGFASSMNQIKRIEFENSLRLLRELSFEAAWGWFSSLKGILVGRPDADIEIAVCNFIALFDENADASGARDLIWSFAGLEALLAESESGIVSQLRQKLIAIFGNQVDIKDFDKNIKDMYQVRSNIIHGKTKDIPSIQGFVLQEQDMTSRSQQVKAAVMAMYLLASTIQYCCQNNLSSIKFKTVVV
jgi:hypothetical protein